MDDSRTGGNITDINVENTNDGGLNKDNVQLQTTSDDSQDMLNTQEDDPTTLRRSARGLIPKVFKEYFTGYNADIVDNVISENPETYADVLTRKDKNEWLKAIEEEVKSMDYNNS